MAAFSEHFSNAELMCKCGCGQNECKQALVDALELFRTAVGGKPVIVTSGYRDPEHNRKVGGVPNSDHALGLAADVRVTGMNAAQLYEAALKVPAFANGGIGVAPAQNYVHLGVRDVPARWAYNDEGKWCAWNLDAYLAANKTEIA